MRILSVFAFAMLASCQTYGQSNELEQAAQPSPTPTPTTAQQVPTLVSATCAGCHAVEASALSPIANAPTFEVIANRDGLTKETLTAYLSDAHNYPDQMDVEVDAADIKVIAEYMLSLRTQNYERGPS